MQNTDKEYKIVFTIKLKKNVSIEEILASTEYIDILADDTVLEIKNPAVYDSNNKQIA